MDQVLSVHRVQNLFSSVSRGGVKAREESASCSFVSVCMCLCVCRDLHAQPCRQHCCYSRYSQQVGTGTEEGELPFTGAPRTLPGASREKAGAVRARGLRHGGARGRGQPGDPLGKGARGRVQATRAATGLCGEVAPSGGHGPGRETRCGASPRPPSAARYEGHSTGGQRTRTSAPSAPPAPFPGCGRVKWCPFQHPCTPSAPAPGGPPDAPAHPEHPAPTALSALIRYTPWLGIPRPQRQPSPCSATLQPALPPAPRGIPRPEISGMLRRGDGSDPGGGGRRRRGRVGLHPGPRPT